MPPTPLTVVNTPTPNTTPSTSKNRTSSKKVAPTHGEPVGGGPTTRSKTTNTIADDSPPPMRTRAAAKGNMTPTKRGRLQRVAENLMGISTIDFFNYVSENSATRDFERAYTTLGFGDEPLSREEAMARPDWD